MFDLCKILGVEEGEVFKLNGTEYKIENNKFKHKSSDTGEFVAVSYSLNLLAEAEIERQPFVPKFDEQYFYVNSQCNILTSVNDHHGNDMDRIKSGNCFRTEQEAEEKGVPLMEQWKKELGW